MGFVGQVGVYVWSDDLCSSTARYRFASGGAVGHPVASPNIWWR